MVDIKISILNKKEYSSNEYNNAMEYIRYAGKRGVKKLILTSELNAKEDDVSIEEMKRRVEKLNADAYKEGIKIDICYGQVVNISQDSLYKCLDNEVATIKDSRYVLVNCGTSMTNEKVELIFELTIKGMIPVVMHPEGYVEIIERNSRIEKLKEFGCLFALDINNLNGKNGTKAKALAKRFLSEGQYQFAFCDGTSDIKKSIDRYKASLSKSNYDKFNKNGLKMIKDQLVDGPSETIREKKGVLSILGI